MIDLITELTELLVQDNAILFVGSGLRYAQDEEPSIDQIAEGLAERIAYQRSDRSLPAVARDFEVQHGRHALISALREELGKLPRQPAPIHQLIADAVLPTTKVITTRFDQILEQALDQFQKEYVVIVRDTDVPFFDQSKVTLIKMQGDIQQPESLIITQDDVNDFIRKLPTLSDVIRAFFATKTLIFLGYDLSSDLFKRFFGQVNRNVSVFSRTAYAIVPKLPDEVEISYWEKQNVKICPYKPVPFLEALSKGVQKAISRPPTKPHHTLTSEQATLPARPYKGLESFTADDTLIFVGRAEESQRLTNRILAHRLIVFYGESGSGKSSLLRAGVTPTLAKQRALCVMAVPAPGQPLPEVIYRELLAAGQKAGLEPPATDSVPAIIRAWQGVLNAPIVFAIDQFEQLFLAYDAEEREVAAAFLQQLKNDRSLNVRLVLTLREDFLGRLQTLSAWLPDILSVRFRLERLGREEAQAAIEEPAALFDVRWESRLVQQLLDALYERAGGGISPAQLQIVCQRLYEQVEQERAGILSAEISLALFEQLGGTAKILGDYLDETLKKLPSEQQPLAWELLTALVSSSGVKQRLPLSDLAHATNIEPSEAQAILEQLRNQRLVHRYIVSTKKGQEARLEYELTHDYLATHLADSLDASFWALQKAREIVRQALPEWQRESALLPPDKLRFVSEQREGLRLSQKEVEMLYAAAVTYDKQPEQWVSLLPLSAWRRLLLNLLQHTEPAIRALAPRHLASGANAAVGAALTERYLTDTVPEVREAALQALVEASRTHPNVAQIAIECLVAVRNDPVSASLARQGIVRLRDQQPIIQNLLPPKLRSPVQREVWGMRWQRNRQRIRTARSRGTWGGLWGFGFGMAFLLMLIDSDICQHSTLNIGDLLGLGTVGFALTGFFGAVVAGSTAFVQVLLHALQDLERPWPVWAVTTSAGTLLMGLGFLLMGALQGQSAASAISGMLIGFALTSVATAPLPLSRSPRLGLAALAAVTGFLLAEQLGLILQGCPSTPPEISIGPLTASHLLFQSVILTIAGLSSGVGFFWGLNSE
ncbi:MAG: SIR2 family protein [Ardenticatenaceae bacterium]